MKKAIVCFSLTLILVLAMAISACAFDEEIRLLGLPWGATENEITEQLPYSFDKLDPLPFWSTVQKQMEPYIGGYDYFTELGGVITSRSGSLEVAGYSADRLILYFISLPDEHGRLTLDQDKVSFVHARYKLYSNRPDKDFPDLVQKFSALYGKPDLEKTYDDSSIPGEYSLWYGANGTMVSLTRADFPRQGKYVIYADYGWSGNDELAETAYAAFQKNAEQ